MKEFCHEHYNQITGIEEVKNLSIPKKNINMLEGAELSSADKQRWKETMEKHAEHIIFFPSST